MIQLFTVGLVNALLATLLAIAVWLITRKWRHPVFVHVLWVVVLVKLVTPPLVAIPWPVLEDSAMLAVRDAAVDAFHADFAGQATEAGGAGLDDPPPRNEAGAVIAAGVPSPAARAPDALPEEGAAAAVLTDRVEHGQPDADRSELPSSAAFDAADATSASASPAVPPSPAVAQPPAEPRDQPNAWLYLAVAVWLGGSALYLAIASVRVIRFHRALRGTQPAPAPLQQSADAVAARLSVAPRVRVRLTAARLAPLVWPLGRPTILLSQPLIDELAPAEIDTLLAHELAHLRRKDHWVRWLEIVVSTSYWWHPVVWWARRSIQQAEERACDAWVVGTFPDAARHYAGALFKAAQFASKPPQPSVSLASRLTPGGNLKERIENIMNASFHRRLPWPHRIVVAMVVLLLLPVSLRAVQSSPESARAAESSSAEEAAPTGSAAATPSEEPASVLSERQPARTVSTVASKAPDDPYRIQPGDMVHVWVFGAHENAPIQDVFMVEPSGSIALGPLYGRVNIRGANLETAEDILTEHLSKTLQNPLVQVSLAHPREADSTVGAQARLTPREAEIQERLKQPVRPQYHEVPLEEVLRHLSDECDVDIYLDPIGLDNLGIARDEPVTLALNKPISLQSALNLVLDPLGLTHRIEDEVLKIVPAESDQPAAGSHLAPSPAPPVDTHRQGAESSDITAKLAWAAESMRSPISLRLLQQLLESQHEERVRLEKLHEEGKASAREVRNAAVELQILLERIRQTERELEQRRLLRDIAQLEVEKAFEANERTAGSVSSYELKKLELQVDLAEAKVREIGE